MFGAWSIISAWHLFWSTATLATLIGCGAAAVAILLPPALSAITDLRKWAIVVVVCAFGYGFTYSKGYSDGLAVKQAEWDSGLVKEAALADQDRTDAVRIVGPVPADRRVFRSDPFNRDRDGAVVK
jgi:hypothetical protein